MTVVSTLQDRLLSVTQVPRELWAEGAEVVALAQAATGFPTHVAVSDIRAHTAGRQNAALGVWLASETSPHGSVVVGHALLTRLSPADPGWSTVRDRTTRIALATGRLVELGGLAVRPDRTGNGAAEALVRARLAWLREHDLVGCSSVWRGSAGSTRLAERYGRRVARRTDRASDRFVYDR
ncbi:GNAT family N-acetyltransferase [Nocardioides jiangxiensis]|uniref:GNAT family N-acetyltransferase n=1 Tax=Nocardioides jiangxiensis TaxID=3064524 RepID=A0ABT9B2E0_9ACTN|nr:GNAT family N-acetyltransferase [Nocardioides sp. WY-20]MDO7869021.1 GNAT family N-acetyltransferase [Nocardioides sp. WY-20]